jgi:hypothetical protein
MQPRASIITQVHINWSSYEKFGKWSIDIEAFYVVSFEYCSPKILRLLMHVDFTLSQHNKQMFTPKSVHIFLHVKYCG